jgi:hypothetical protein
MSQEELEKLADEFMSAEAELKTAEERYKVAKLALELRLNTAGFVYKRKRFYLYNGYLQVDYKGRR